ncbi:MAG TPA: hypothetical protein VHS58_23770 [Acetobacteraceae bacterium]|jgi:hypothetical protein|nr:hypothetical protein [Acetobacteraceae bacterium]
MIFSFLKRRRIEQLAAVGNVVTADALARGEAPRPRRLIRTQLGYGTEIWADYGEVTRFTRTPRMVRGGKLVIGVDDAAGLATKLQIPFEMITVRF